MSYAMLDEGFLHSSSSVWPEGRRVWRQAAVSGTPSAVIVFLDAELYIERMKAPEVLQRLQEVGSIPPVAAVYISHGGSAARHVDFTCNADYAVFLVEDVLEAMQREGAASDHRRVVLVGLSLSGLAAAYVSSRFPDRFLATISQSPSFWWEDERFREELPPAGASSPRYWVSVGDRETEKDVLHAPSGMRQRSTQIEACEKTCAVMRDRGYAVNYRVFGGGHDPDCWREDLEIALPWVWRGA